jgi:hypothetical protein
MNNRTALLINSRGNPERLAGMCLAFQDLAAQPGLLTFCIRADADDTDTVFMAGRLGKLADVRLLIGSRPQALGEEINKLVRQVDAGVYHVVNDDTWPLTRHWDLAPLAHRNKSSEGPAFVSCWMLAGPTAPDYPIVTKEWLEATDGKLFTSYFPYWFDDRWLADVAIMLRGKLVDPLQIYLCANKRATQRMRDLSFWMAYYLALQDERVAMAQRVADNLELGIDIRRDRAEWVKKTYEWHSDLADKADELELKAGDKGPPDSAYLAAKAAAEKHMIELVEAKAA